MLKILGFSILLFFHPVHVTITSIDYIPEADSFKVFVRMYFDDFIRDCKLNGQEVNDQDFSAENASSQALMESYLKEKIIIEVNKKQVPGKLCDIKISDNEVSMNLDYGTLKKPKTITVKNLIMTGLYADQANMIILRVNDFEEGVKLTSELTEQTFKIK